MCVPLCPKAGFRQGLRSNNTAPSVCLIITVGDERPARIVRTAQSERLSGGDVTT